MMKHGPLILAALAAGVGLYLYVRARRAAASAAVAEAPASPAVPGAPVDPLADYLQSLQQKTTTASTNAGGNAGNGATSSSAGTGTSTGTSGGINTTDSPSKPLDPRPGPYYDTYFNQHASGGFNSDSFKYMEWLSFLSDLTGLSNPGGPIVLQNQHND